MSTLRRPESVALIVVVALACLLLVPATAPAAPCDPPVASAVACENTLPGTPQSVWRVTGAGDPSIQGFATQMSVDRGQTIDFKINAPNANFHVDVYRLGYYGGNGARRVASGITPSGRVGQPACLTDGATGLIDCGNWAVSASWAVPASAVSGVYIARLTRDDTGGASLITFVVRADGSRSDLLVQTSDAAWQAYNTYGGNSLYQCTVACPPGNPLGYKAAFKVSYNRPMHGAEDDAGGRSFLWWSEYPMIRFLEANGYDVSYTSEQDVQAGTAGLTDHHVFVSSGHDEYWSRTQRANVEAARAAGVNLAFFSGNEVFWKTRNEASIAPGGGAGRTLVAYKDTHFSQQIDPVEWTGTWRDPRFTTPPNRPTPENALTGQSFVVNDGSSSITVPAAYRRLRLWRNTTAASLGVDQSLQLAPQTLGYEWDADADNGFRPAGAFDLSSTTVSGVENFTDYGSTVQPGSTSTHNMTLYRAPGGALVFGAGTVQWSWGLDSANPNNNAPNRDMQQATVNLFADMGVQPATLLPGLVTAAPSADTTRPASAITAPAGGTIADGTRDTITGTASDGGGGVVAGVEVSTDGGATWHEATGTTNWTYTWIAHGAPRTTIRSRAVDDSGNLEVPGAGVTVSVGCPCSLWGPDVAPLMPDSGDPSAVEVGVRFTSDVSGLVTGVRFYKAAANTGTHTGSLWTVDGTLLARATFTAESATGWQTATFATPVAIQGGATYVVSYHAPAGHYATTDDYLYPQPAPGPNGGSEADASPLHALRGTGDAGSNGVFAYGTAIAFPTNSFHASNYWVTPVFTPTPPGPPAAPDAVAAQPASHAALVSWGAPAGVLTGYTVTPYVGASAQAPIAVAPTATSTVIGGLANGTAYTFRVTARGANGTGPASAPSGVVVPLSTLLDFAVPAVPDSGDGQAVEVGMKWTADVSGLVTGVRFYKAVANTGTHTGSVWTTTGSRLAQATFTGETASGWQSASFATPVAVKAGTTYIVSYFAPAGHYSLAENGFAAAVDNPPLHGVANAVSGNGVYGYGASSTFPTASFAASDYWVDVFFSPQPGGGTGGEPTGGAGGGPTPAGPGGGPVAGPVAGPVTGGAPRPGAPTDVLARPATRQAFVSWTAPAGDAVSAFTVTPYRGTTALPAVTITGTARSATITGLLDGTSYRFVVTAANAGGAGTPSAPSAAVIPRSTVLDFARPALGASGDRNAVEVGVKLRVDEPGTITGIRFYKGAGNTGVHVGSLWSAAGVRLGRVTFTGESAGGWQSATFAAPVPVRPGRTYVASYFAPRGHYAATAGAFGAHGLDNPPLHATPTAVSPDGVYAYGPASRFPNNTFDATAYWVDALFAPAPGTRGASPRAARAHPAPEGG